MTLKHLTLALALAVAYLLGTGNTPAQALTAGQESALVRAAERIASALEESNRLARGRR